MWSDAWHALLNAGFKESQDGKTVFYPYGVMGCGYIVSERTEKRIRNLRAVYVSMFIFTVFLGFLILFGLATISYVIAEKFVLLSSEKTNEKMNTGSWNEADIKVLMISLFMLVCAIVLFILDKTPKGKAMSLMSLCLFVYLLFFYLYRSKASSNDK